MTGRDGTRGGWLRILLASSALVAAGCATPAPAPVELPTADERRAAAAAGFELPTVGSAGELLPADLLQGSHYVVQDEVYTDGYTHVFTIESDYGTFTANGDDMLRVRLREIEALAAIDEMSATKEFATAAGKALASPFVAAWNVITHPVDTVLGIPGGAWDAIERTGDLATSDRGELEDSAFAEFIGFETKKRQIAAELGVDPYSSNKTLQRELNRFGWAAYAGGLPSLLIPFKEGPDDDDAAAPAADSADRLQEILRQYSPEDLDRLNRIELTVMGVPGELCEEFIAHPWYSPRYETTVVENLAALDLARDRRTFIEMAITAESENDAHFYQRTAELIRRYNEADGRIEKIVAFDGTLAGYAADGTLVVPLAADHAIWSRDTAAFTDSFTSGLPAELEVQKTELLLSGTLSPKARAQIEARGVEVIENALDRPHVPPDLPVEARE